MRKYSLTSPPKNLIFLRKLKKRAPRSIHPRHVWHTKKSVKHISLRCSNGIASTKKTSSAQDLSENKLPPTAVMSDRTTPCRKRTHVQWRGLTGHDQEITTTASSIRCSRECAKETHACPAKVGIDGNVRSESKNTKYPQVK